MKWQIKDRLGTWNGNANHAASGAGFLQLATALPPQVQAFFSLIHVIRFTPALSVSLLTAVKPVASVRSSTTSARVVAPHRSSTSHTAWRWWAVMSGSIETAAHTAWTWMWWVREWAGCEDACGQLEQVACLTIVAEFVAESCHLSTGRHARSAGVDMGGLGLLMQAPRKLCLLHAVVHPICMQGRLACGNDCAFGLTGCASPPPKHSPLSRTTSRDVSTKGRSAHASYLLAVLRRD